MPSPHWWTKLRAKLRPSSSKGDKHEPLSTPDSGLLPVAPAIPSPALPQTTMPNDVAETISPHDFLPYERMQDALVSAAPSEPASQVSSAGYGGAGLFTGSAMHQGAGLLPRMAVQSGQSYVADGTLQHQAPIVVDPSFDINSLDGRQDMSGAAGMTPPTTAQAPVPEAQSKLTAAALGTHSTLSEGVARQHRGHRKMHFIKNWLQDAETDEVDVVSAQPVTTSQDPLPPAPASGQDSQAGAHNASRDGSSQLPTIKQLFPAPLQQLDSPMGKASAISPQGLAKAMASVDTSRNDSSISSAPGMPGLSAGGLSLRETMPVPPTAPTRPKPTMVTPAASTAMPAAAPQPPSSAPLAVTDAAAPAATTKSPAVLPVLLQLPASIPATHVSGAALQPNTQASSVAAMAGTSPTPGAALPPSPAQPQQQAAQQQQPQPLQLPQQQQQQQPQAQLQQAGPSNDRNPTRRFASLNAASSEAPAAMSAPGEPDGVATGGRWQSRPESEGLENYLASAVTTMTVTSQVEGPDIPKRVAVPSLCSAVISSPNTRVGEASANPAALRLPSAASHESTKTIAVAGHCPEDIAAQQWSVDDFVLLRKLYEGALSVICHAQHKKSGRHVALKIYKRSRLHEMERFQLAREICLHIRILHPHILSLYAAWKDSKYVYLVLEWAPHGNLFELLVSKGGKLSEAEAARHIIRPLLSSLAFLHSHSWLHRDIKLENVLLDAQGMVKLCDFGLAIDQKFEQANTRLGTFGYFAPEVLDCPLKKGPFDFKGEPGVPTYGCKVDIWSMGVMSYELLTGKAPFAASSAAKIIDAIRTRDLVYPASLSTGARDFLAAALVRDPEQRASADQLLQHPWLLSQ